MTATWAIARQPRRVVTTSSRDRKAVAGTASPPIRKSRSAAPPIPAARTSCGCHTGGQLHGGQSDLNCQHRPAPAAAFRPLRVRLKTAHLHFWRVPTMHAYLRVCADIGCLTQLRGCRAPFHGSKVCVVFSRALRIQTKH